MTNFSELTDQELNEWIAVKRGICVHDLHDYKKDNRGYCGDYTQWRCRKCKKSFGGLHYHGGKMFEDMPNYSTSWQYAGELLEEVLMDNVGNSFEYQPNLFPNRPWSIMGIVGNGSTSPTRAIAESWSMWSQNER
jgi:hypothetical protein